jgi:hypothetical protein
LDTDDRIVDLSPLHTGPAVYNGAVYAFAAREHCFQIGVSSPARTPVNNAVDEISAIDGGTAAAR